MVEQNVLAILHTQGFNVIVHINQERATSPANLENAELLAGEILRMCISLGGSITGEHGVGVEKLKYVPAMFADSDVDTMLAIRRAIDPQELANRGKLLPVNTKIS